MTILTDGIVIREQPTGETDKLLTILTQKNGVIRAFANGARNPKNKNAAASSLLCFAHFSLEKSQKGVYSVRESTAKEVFFSLRNDLVRLSLAQYFAEIAFELSPREEDAAEALKLLLNAVYLVSQGKRDLRLIKAATELRFCCLAGFMPQLVACAFCGAYESEEMKFSVSTGRLFCEDCAPHEEVTPLPLSVVCAMRHICFSESDRVFSFRLTQSASKKLAEICEQYLRSVTGRYYKTLDFYKSMTESDVEDE